MLRYGVRLRPPVSTWRESCSAHVADKEGEDLQNGKEEEEEEEEEENEFTPEEAKLWKTVQEAPSDFSSWTQLLQLVEQKVEEKDAPHC